MKNGEYILPEDIKCILSKYYDGMTSLEEEKLLKKYFKDHQIPESQFADQAILSFTKPDNISLYPAKDIWEKIKQSETSSNRYKALIRMASSIAASIIILISIGTWYYISSDTHNKLATDTYSNPKDAYKTVQKYLGFTSSKLSYAYQGIKPIEKLAIPGEAIKPFEDIDKNIMRLNQLNRLNKTSKEMEHLSIITDIIKVDKN
jgi:hypothetical protein